ncbi:fatty-acid amide hydrolase 2-A-like [Gigantopelta aegis]|uniref:fatty-acid amide hydrolase 2-A-like n=1 Tax=Gigantopelta aegis TaxID=1735272 RepID=UPI001B889AC2|nr:fatty-acid amide hydrolase 2-A-like [Gigantopelta aegis]XP_041354860.1 fatty-acid amide hydrolase 2-A-like [Gigantopelta aegis]
MRLIQSVTRCVLTMIGCVMNPIINLMYSFIYQYDKRSVPPIKDPVLCQSAMALAKKIRSRELKAVDVMGLFIARVNEVNPLTNAVVADRFNEAIEEAVKVDTMLDEGNVSDKFSEKNAPLLGVPLSVKEAFAVKGMPNSSGLVARRNFIANFDAVAVAKLRAAGAIPFVMTNTSELCMWLESANNVYGRTRNPYNLSRIVGGSSGGEGCNISSGAAVIGIGSDIGGSIRMPCFFNGIYGHRSSRGSVSNEGQHPPATAGQQVLLSTGPMCRYSEDLLPMLKLMSGNPPELKLDELVDVKTLQFFTMEDDTGSLFLSNVDPQLKACQQKAVDYLEESLGVSVTRVGIRRMKYSLEMWSSKMATAHGTPFASLMAEETGSVNCATELLKWVVGRSDHTLPAIGLGLVEKLDYLRESYHPKFLDMLEKLELKLQEMLGDNGVLLYPTHPVIAPYHNQPLLTPFNFAYTGIFNALGLPVTQCPVGLSKEGLPVGFQIVGSMNGDRQTIAVARHVEEGLGGWVPPGAVSYHQ